MYHDTKNRTWCACYWPPTEFDKGWRVQCVSKVWTVRSTLRVCGTTSRRQLKAFHWKFWAVNSHGRLRSSICRRRPKTSWFNVEFKWRGSNSNANRSEYFKLNKLVKKSSNIDDKNWVIRVATDLSRKQRVRANNWKFGLRSRKSLGKVRGNRLYLLGTRMVKWSQILTARRIVERALYWAPQSSTIKCQSHWHWWGADSAQLRLSFLFWRTTN